MPTYKGNVGNLMQHWTLCELLNVAHQQGIPGLNFIDAHAMAPLAQYRDGTDNRFDRVRDNLPGQQSPYEQAWQYHAPKAGYPNSAAFVDQVWPGDFSLLLCETRPATVRALEAWREIVDRSDRCRRRTQVWPRDWRVRFDQGLPSPGDVGLKPESLTLVSFDPYKCNTRGEPNGEGDDDLYPEDIERVRDQSRNLEGQILIQLSTYDTPQGDQDALIAQVCGILGDFELAAAVRIPDRPMMSMVFTHCVPWFDQLENLHDDFNDWLPQV